MIKPYSVLPHNQRGATLVIALLILVMIMMYGIPAAMDSMQNERMAGNTRNRDLAFQAAEHAIKEAESWIIVQTATSLNDLAPAALPCSDDPDVPDDADRYSGDGILPNGECHANDAAYWRDTFNWVSNGIHPSDPPINSTASINQTLVSAQPLLVVERMPDVCYAPSGGSCPPSIKKSYYRVTARALGKDNASVILQTLYEFPE